MSANRLFLVCSACLQPERAFCLGERGISSPLYETTPDLEARLDAWYRTHQACGSGPDHYQLAHNFPPNHDVATPQSAIAPAVRLALVSDRQHGYTRGTLGEAHGNLTPEEKIQMDRDLATSLQVTKQ